MQKFFDGDAALLQVECQRFITRAGYAAPPFARIFQMYLQFQEGRRVLDVYEWLREQRLPVDIRKAVTFGVIKGFLCQVRRHEAAEQPKHPGFM